MILSICLLIYGFQDSAAWYERWKRSRNGPSLTSARRNGTPPLGHTLLKLNNGYAKLKHVIEKLSWRSACGLSSTDLYLIHGLSMDGPNARLEGDQWFPEGFTQKLVRSGVSLTSRIRITLIKYVPISLSKDSCMVLCAYLYSTRRFLDDPCWNYCVVQKIVLEVCASSRLVKAKLYYLLFVVGLGHAWYGGFVSTILSSSVILSHKYNKTAHWILLLYLLQKV